ncbi:MAG: peptide chain release factor N(5)-glutamine methyltransferase [Pseudomonadota bacterium]
MRVRDLLRAGAAKLSKAGANADDPMLGARLLLQHVLAVDAAGLIARDNDPVASDDEAAFLAAIEQAREWPVYRVIGQRPFYGLSFRLNAATLEPRDDTETLVDAVLDRLKRSDPTLSAPWRFADLGTGTGAVGLALLSQLTNSQAVLTDVSAEALQAAKDNAHTTGLSWRCVFACGCWLEPLVGTFDFIVSNPPYIPTADVAQLDAAVRNVDPRLALDGGGDGLDAYRHILSESRACLHGGGFLALEMGFDQGQPLSDLGHAMGWSVASVHRDLGHRERVIVFE